MKTAKQKSHIETPATINRKWYVVDATDRILGRLATRVATVLMGKHKPTYTPFIDTGDFVVVLNAGKVKLSGKKRQTKKYKHYTGYPSGLKEVPFETMIQKKPAEVVRHAVSLMLPKTKLGRHMAKKLKVYAGAEHPHEAQKPEPLKER